jgi:hypothetical protein
MPNSTREVLQALNAARMALRMAPLTRLPPGLRRQSQLCVLGRALRLEILLDEQERAFVLVREYRQASRLAAIWNTPPQEAWYGWAVLLPAQLDHFVHEFDAGYHSRLALRQQRYALRAAMKELKSLRSWALQMRSRVSELALEGDELCRRSRELCQQGRRPLCVSQPDNASTPQKRKAVSSSAESFPAAPQLPPRPWRAHRPLSRPRELV